MATYNLSVFDQYYEIRGSNKFLQSSDFDFDKQDVLFEYSGKNDLIFRNKHIVSIDHLEIKNAPTITFQNLHGQIDELNLPDAKKLEIVLGPGGRLEINKIVARNLETLIIGEFPNISGEVEVFDAEIPNIKKFFMTAENLPFQENRGGLTSKVFIPDTRHLSQIIALNQDNKHMFFQAKKKLADEKWLITNYNGSLRNEKLAALFKTDLNF